MNAPKTKRLGVTVADLPDDPPEGVCLYCPKCEMTFSACRGDYFFMSSDAVLRCAEDGKRLDLVEKEVSFVPWSKP